MRLLNLIVELVSGEWLLTRCRYANGGGIILSRAVWAAAWLYLATIGVKEWCEPSTILKFDPAAFRDAFSKYLPWFGAIFAGVYATLHSRYASQWTYLANVYNRIKETEAKGDLNDGPARIAIAEWKAGFLEDAEDLHLIHKPMFASVFRKWSEDPEVEKAFCTYTEKGGPRWQALVALIPRTTAIAPSPPAPPG